MAELPQGVSVGVLSFSTFSNAGQAAIGFSSLGECPVEQISHHTCNSVYPAVTFDMVGNAGVAWHDSRDGNWEIYFKALASHLGGQACCGRISPQTVMSGGGTSGQCAVGFSSVSMASLYSVDDTGTDTTSLGAANQNANAPKDTGEARITCTEGATLFPDVVADRKGRFHLVYQDQASGQSTQGNSATSVSNKFEILYNQVYPKEIGEKNGCTASAGVSTNGMFGAADGGVADNYGTFFTHGDPLLADPTPNQGPGLSASEQTGLHRLFRDYYVGTDGSWTGLSKAADRYPLWNSQFSSLPPSPTYVAAAGNPMADVGDFGASYQFSSVALMTQSPPHNPIEISLVRLPLKPKCVPLQPPKSSSGMRIEDLVSAPTRPLPPTFVDPVDLSSVLNAPGTTVDSGTSPRYMIDGNESTVFTNILTDGGQTRLVFHREEIAGELKFILGQVKCGTENCAVKVPNAGLTRAATNSKKIKLQVWEGGSYRNDDTLVDSDSLSATLVLEKEFTFEPGDDCSRFSFTEKELKVRRGRLLFFVPSSEDFDFHIDGVGRGHAVWSTSGDGTFAQYHVPYTVSPNSGMDAPVYYEGKLLTPQCPESAATAASSPMSVKSISCNLSAGGALFSSWSAYSYSNFLTSMTVTNNTAAYLYAYATVNVYDHNGTYVTSSTNTATKYIQPRATMSLSLASWVNIPASQNETFSFKVQVQAYSPLGISIPKVVAGTGYITYSNGVITNVRGISNATAEAVSELLSVSTLNGPFGAAYSPSAKSLVFSLNAPTGTPNNFATVGKATAAYGTDDSGTIKGVQGNLFIDIAQDEGAGSSRGGFKAGEMFYDSGDSVVKLDPTGKKAATYTLTGEAVRGLCIDRANVVGGDLLVACTSGNVWRIGGASDAVPVKVGKCSEGAQGSVLEGIAAIPNQDAYGPWAGKILACSPGSSKVYAMDPTSGTATGYAVQVGSSSVSPSGASIVFEEENLFVTDTKSVLGMAASSLANIANSVLITQSSPGRMVKVTWDKTAKQFSFSDFASAQSMGQIVFSSSGLGVVPDVSAGCASSDPDAPTSDPTSGCGNYGNISNLMVSVPRRLTSSSGSSEHARLAIDNSDNIWMVFHSDRSGTDEVYVSRYAGNCGVWLSSGQGGSDIRLSSFGPKGQAKFPNVAVDAMGEAHVVFQGTAPEDGRWEIYYVRSTGGGKAFTDPIRLTSSPGDAMMPDIVVSYPEGMGKKITVVWHDDRFNNFEIMAANYADGEWNSSGQGGSDLRITQTRYKSVFPRIAADFNSNMRVVYQSYRATDPSDQANTLPAIYMSTYVASKDQWESSGQGWADREMSETPEGASSMAPDIDIECQNGPMTVWHDDRLKVTTGNPNQHEEVFGAYCTRLTEHFGGPHFKPIQTNNYRAMSVQVKIVDPITNYEIESTNSPNVALQITAPGATFWRGANEDGQFSAWDAFRASIDLDTTIVPWQLSCKSGSKRLCIQVQDSQFVSYPICQTITLTAPPPTFTIELFSDAEMLDALPLFKNWPAAMAGAVHVRLTSSQLLLEPPTFDVVSRGLHIVRNQATEAIADASEAVTVTSATGGTAGTSYATGNRTFKGEFDVYREDGLFHIDGLARLVPHGKDACGNPF
jgi:hypothetical protein